MDDDLVLAAVLGAIAAAALRGGRRRRDPRCGGWIPPGPRSLPRPRCGEPGAPGWLPGRPPPASRSRSKSRRERAPEARRRSRRGRAPSAPRPRPRGRAPPSRAPRRGCDAPPWPPSARTAPGEGRWRSSRRRSGGDRRAGAGASRRPASRARILAEVCFGSTPGPVSAQSVRWVRPATRCSSSSGITMSAGGNEDHCEAPPPSGANAKPPTQTGPAPGWQGLGLRTQSLAAPASRIRQPGRRSDRAHARPPHGRCPGSRARTHRGRAAPSRTSDRRQGATRTPPRSDRPPRLGP